MAISSKRPPRRPNRCFQPPLNATFIHRQTLANQCRFTTVELADLDAKIAQAADRALAIEAETFEAFRVEAVQLAQPIQAAAAALSTLDVAVGLAEWAVEAEAVRPEIDASLAFEAEAARHPVVEAAVRRAGDPYTPNDCRFDGGGPRLPTSRHRHRDRIWRENPPSCAKTRSSPSSLKPDRSSPLNAGSG